MAFFWRRRRSGVGRGSGGVGVGVGRGSWVVGLAAWVWRLNLLISDDGLLKLAYNWDLYSSSPIIFFCF